ncbi:hypothetical protein JCM10908_002617 [Rhodotorula pacifica]|uniref:uncharacterized protein n=1 Tax=Rhodotorula pacifica TaxID=1495444 RepID=UPI003176535E
MAVPPAFPRTVSLQPTPHSAAASSGRPKRYPHRRARRWWNGLRTIGTYFLFLLIFVALLASLVDFGRAIIFSDRTSKVSDLFIAFGSYLAVIVFGFGMVIVRRIANSRAVAAIPQAYVPVQAEDVSKAAHELIRNEYDRACLVTRVSQPKGQVQPGWGRPGSAFEGVHFRSSILSTVSALRTALEPLFPDPMSQPHILSRSGSLSPLAPLLALPPGESPVPDALRPLADLYEAHLVKAKYAKAEPTEVEWDQVVKAVAVFVGVLTSRQASSPAAA